MFYLAPFASPSLPPGRVETIRFKHPHISFLLRVSLFSGSCCVISSLSVTKRVSAGKEGVRKGGRARTKV